MFGRGLTIVINVDGTHVTASYPLIDILITNLNTKEHWLYSKSRSILKHGFYHLHLLINNTLEEEMNLTVSNNSLNPLYILISLSSHPKMFLFSQETDFVTKALPLTLRFPTHYFSS